jgi:DNA recombination protein RmuC
MEIIIALSVSLTLLSGYLIFRQRVVLKQLKEFSNLLSSKEQELNNYKIKNATLQTQLVEKTKSFEQKLEILQNSEAKLKTEFENLANKIFDANSKKLSEQNQENLGLILNPMKQQIGEFKKKVEDVYEKEAKERGLLQYELKSLKELNLKMSEDATKLTNALKGEKKTQGNWGEMVLERVLESSGLRAGYEYDREVQLKDEQNNSFRPDVVVNLPEDRHIIIDAKTSLNSYNEFISNDDESTKQLHLKNHILALKNHIKLLSEKKYENLKNINSLDFIFMFVPIEAALLIALENDVNLYDEAFKQKIILVSPTTLLVALRAVENTWRYEKQAQSISDVYYRAEELYKKFYGFVEDLKKVGDSLEKANENYNEAFKKLESGRGNLISQATMLKKISNIKPKKELDSGLVDNAMTNHTNSESLDNKS